MSLTHNDLHLAMPSDKELISGKNNFKDYTNVKSENEINNFEVERINSEEPSKKFKPIPKKITCLAFFLLIAGIAFLIAGLQQYFLDDKWRGVAFIILGNFFFLLSSLQTAKIKKNNTKN